MTATEDKTAKAKAAAAAKAKAEKEQQEKDKQNAPDLTNVEPQNNDGKDKGEREKNGLEDLEIAKKNDKKTPQVTHDEVMDQKLAHASTRKAREAEAANYRLQQAKQAQLERDTQHGLGNAGIRKDGEK